MESSFTFWLTGLSGAGKTSLGEAIALHYRKKGLPTVLLDGDVLRSSISKDLGYSEEERMEQNRRAAALAKLLNRQGITVFAALISPLEKIRKEIEDQIGKNQFFLIHVACSLDECIRRDVKKHYEKALKTTSGTFTGIHQTYEAPVNPWLTVDTENYDKETCVNQLIEAIDALVH